MYYYVNDTAQSNGDHEVHTSECQFVPGEDNRTYLGDFGSCSDAVERAGNYYDQVNGCATCSRACHTQ